MENIQVLFSSLYCIQVMQMIRYDPLWKTMASRGITTYTLIETYHFSRHTIYRLRHNSGISTALIDQLCKILNCRVEDILCYIPDENKSPAG